VMQEAVDHGLDWATQFAARCALAQCFATNAIFLVAEGVGDIVGGNECG